MKYALKAGWALGDVDGRAKNSRKTRIIAIFSAIPCATVVLADSPVGIIRGSRDNAYVVTACCKPFGHITCVFADSSQLGSIIEPVKKDAEWS
jgi:hypothetical protein